MKDKKRKKRNIRWTLVLYDLLVFALAAVLLLGLYGGNDKLTYNGMVQQEIWRHSVLHQITVYRCGSFSGLYVFRNVAGDRKDYFCEDAVSGMPEPAWCTDTSYGISLCI